MAIGDVLDAIETYFEDIAAVLKKTVPIPVEEPFEIEVLTEFTLYILDNGLFGLKSIFKFDPDR